MRKFIIGLMLIFVLVVTVACAQAEPATGPAVTKPVTTVVPAVTVPGVPPAPTTVAPQGSGVFDSASAERLIVRTGRMTLVVEDIAAAIEDITRLAGTYNGFVVSSNSWQDRDRMMGNITIRVEVQHFDDAIRALRALSVEVRSESTSGQDVTEEYVDLNSRLRNLEAAEAQLLKLMEEEAEKVTDILEVQRELVKTRGEIEQTKGRIQYLEQSSSMSLIEVTLEQSKLTVEFYADPRNVKEGEQVSFYPTVSGGFIPYGYLWDFGDASTSTDEQPDHAYKSDGVYTVTLKITDDRGNTTEYQRTDYITIRAGWNFGNIADGAWNGLVGLFRVLLVIIIWVGIFIPLWIIILIILYFTWWRKRKKKVT